MGVVCRGIEKYVTECSVHYVNAIHTDIQDVSSGQPDAFVEHENAPLSMTTDNAHFPIDRRNWVHIPAVRRTKEMCYQVSEHILRSSCSHCFEKKTVLSIGMKCFVNSKVSLKSLLGGGPQEWFDRLTRGSNKARFEYCVTSPRQIRFLRGLQGHS